MSEPLMIVAGGILLIAPIIVALALAIFKVFEEKNGE